jgi:hypothetical protein
MMERITQIVTLLLVCSMTLFMACEGPQGPEGPQGQQGQQGPVGPAGEDGSMMYSGQGAPDASTGEIGDYYLDTDTGELYGPKDDNGWGKPIIVLKGEDGEDGSQIYAGSGAPDPSLGNLGDFYLDQANYDMYGPKTENGWGTPINLKGADGNANVTRYIFPGHDFASTSTKELVIPNISDRQEMLNSSWNVYLVRTSEIVTHIPGIIYQSGSEYAVQHNYLSSEMKMFIDLINGTGDSTIQIIVVRVKASSTQDQTKQAAKGSIIPDELDVSDYEAVAKYYGFYR